MNTTGVILDGKAIAHAVRQETKEQVAQLLAHQGYVPGLATVLLGEDPASQVYVNSIYKAFHEVSNPYVPYHLPEAP